MATIAFVLLPEMGHINSGFKLAKSLMMRGHRVCYLGLKEFEPVVRSQGVEFISLFEDLYDRGEIPVQASRPSALRNFDLFQSLLMASTSDHSPSNIARIISKEIGKVVERIRPDLFLIDSLLQDFALIITMMGLPGALLHTLLYNDLADDDEIYKPIHALPELVLWPKEFDFPRRAQEARRFYYLEAAVDLERDEPPFPWERISKDKLLIYCSLGSQSHLYAESIPFFQTAIDAMVSRPDWQMILSVGHHLKESDFHGIPPNVMFVNSVPQLSVLKRADMMITHGGINSIKECIFLGVPMIILPVSGDQPMNAARIEYHGLGIRGNLRKASVERIQALISKIEQNPSYKTRIEAMRQRFLEVESSGVGARVIEEIIQKSTTSAKQHAELVAV
jgi:UDP:flavonoid glycosyltransferase YjiC (YdhE family)